ncbi:hypothetical protein JTB14_018609 [Gonioctena quinquepunctata]|nr:hypothetical protein JTB14_018609 [Gonioctena quinquepunctata]
MSATSSSMDDNSSGALSANYFEKRPRGNLVFIEGVNCFIRYYNNRVIREFKKNIRTSYPDIRYKIKKQTKWRHEKHTVRGIPDFLVKIELPKETNDTEFITIPGRFIVKFHRKRTFTDLESYTNELSMVAKSVPGDFGKFYLFVAEYQRVRGHSPMSFLHFLAAYNTKHLEEFLVLYCCGEMMMTLLESEDHPSGDNIFEMQKKLYASLMNI